MNKILSVIFTLINILVFGNQIGFEQNIGQIQDQNHNINQTVIYSLKLENFNINLKNDGFSYDFYEKENKLLKTHRLDFKFKNYNPNYTIEQSNKITYHENIIIENQNYSISFYNKITYKNFYPNIDLEFYVNEDSNKLFEYNFVLHPGADINSIKFETKGSERIINSNQLKFKLRFGELIESLPKSWIITSNATEEVKIEYCQYDDGSIGLQSHQNINNKKVIVDPLPIRKWGTYLSKYTFYGYPRDNHYMSIDRVKFHGSDSYIYGTTSQKNLATQGAFQTTIVNTYQPFLAKFNSNGERIWFTYYGSGFNTEYAGSFDIDNNGNIYLAYTTYGNGMSTNGALNTNNNGYADFLISKFNPNGQRIWSTYYGGYLNENVKDIVVDKMNEVVYIAGNTESNNLQHPHQVQNPSAPNYGQVGLLLKLNLNGNYLSSTYTPSFIESITVDNDYNIIFSGRHLDNNLELTSPFTTTTGNSVLTKYSNNFELIWSKKYLGNGYITEVSSIVTDQYNNIFIAGTTTSTNGIAFGNAYSPSYQFSGSISYAGFLKKLDTNGFEIFGTYIGSKDYTYITDAALGDNNEIIVSGNATRTDNIIFGYNPHQNISTAQINGNGNALLMKFNNSGNPIWGFLAGDSGYGNRYHSIDYNKNTKDIIAVGWNISPYMISTPNAFQLKPIYEHEYGRLIGFNGTISLYSDIENNFKIERTGDDCSINTIIYTASGATNYTWYDYDNTIVSNEATFRPTTIGQYTCKFDNGVNIGYISIIVKEPNLTTPPTPSINYLPQIQEYCFATLTPPTALSGCGEEIIGTTPQTYFDSPGEYLITWTFTDRFENTSTQEQQVEVLVADHFIPDNLILSLCENETGTIFNLKLIESEIPEATYKYYATLSDLENNNSITNPQEYLYNESRPFIYIKGTLANGCQDSKQVALNVQPLPQVNQLQKVLCDTQNIGYITYDLALLQNEVSTDQVKFYINENHTNEITEPIQIQNNQIIYTKVTNTNGCSSSSSIYFTLSTYTIIDSNPFGICKDNGTNGKFNLSVKSQEIATLLNVSANEVHYYATLVDAQNNRNALAETFINNNSLTEIYATIISTDACRTFYKIPLIEHINPVINLENEYYKCKDASIYLTLDQEYDSIEWSNQSTSNSISISSPGLYSVKVRNGFCETIHHFRITDFQDLNIEHTYDGQTISFNILNDQSTKISMDQINWNNSSFIIPPGNHTFYFKSTNGCIEKHQIYIYKNLPTFISPNGDGINDTWNLDYLTDLKSIRIFNRYGKLIFHKLKDNQPIKWDGKFNGNILPSDSYWYTIDLINNQKIEGYILIKNK